VGIALLAFAARSSHPDSTTNKNTQAVVGAGAAGLVTARELRRAGHAVTVYEAQAAPGGVWVYTDAVEEGALHGGHCVSSAGGGGGRQQNGGGQQAGGLNGHAARRVHSSMYAGLRTNLPRHLMSFSDFPFDGDALAAAGAAGAGLAGDGRIYPGHAEVRAYLAAFEAAHGLGELVRYGSRVVGAAPVVGDGGEEGGDDGRPPLPWPRWRVEVEDATAAAAVDTETTTTASTSTHVHDALVVCTGHFAVPRTPADLAISPAWIESGGLVLHSHNYRSPTAGRLGTALAAAGGPGGAVVAVLGAGPSGEDLARELSPACAAVLLCAALWEDGRAPPVGARSNIRACPWLTGVGDGGEPVFAPQPSTASPDSPPFPSPPSPPPRLAAVILATGYRYCFKGLLPPDTVATDDNHVTPLADHLWPPTYAPGLSLVGLPFKVVPFPLMEAQARRIGAALSGAAPLPLPADLAVRAAAQAAARDAAGIPPRHAHCLSGARQWEYMEALAAEAAVGSGSDEGGGESGGRGGRGGRDGKPPPSPPPFMPSWRAALYNAASAARKADPDGYRDDEAGEVVNGAAAVAAAAEAAAWAAAVRARGWSGQ
jgi:hypothetical protein